MRLCRFTHAGKTQLGIYSESTVVPLAAGVAAYEAATHELLGLPASDDLLDFLPPKGKGFAAAKKLAAWVEGNDGKLPNSAELKTSESSHWLALLK